jgi:hypothetical protein
VMMPYSTAMMPQTIATYSRFEPEFMGYASPFS